MGELDIKYYIFNFLDKQDIENYLAGVHLVCNEFHLDFYVAETYLNKWYGGDPLFKTLFKTSVKIAELYHLDLSHYDNMEGFWKDAIPILSRETVELLLLLHEEIWPIGIRRELVKKSKRVA